MSETPNRQIGFFYERLQTFIRCKSSSDALIAPLVLKKKADFELINAFLAIIHDPDFRPREVSFEHSGDVFAHVARVREEDVTRMVDAKARSLSSPDLPPRIPHVVVQAVITAIRDEMMAYASNSYYRGRGGWSRDEEDRTTNNYKQRLGTLLNCSLVHSSWLTPARRAAGVFLRDTRPKIVRLLQNACFGQWTRDLHLRFCDGLPPADHLASLFARVPNVRFLALDFYKTMPDETTAHMMSECISQRLRRVEEIVLIESLSLAHRRGLRNPRFADNLTVLANFLSFPGGLPSLLSFRTVGVNAVLEPHWFSGAPNLMHVHDQLSLPFCKGLLPTVAVVTMSSLKTTDTYGNGEFFVPDHLYYQMVSGVEPSRKEWEIISGLKSLRLDYSVEGASNPSDPALFLRFMQVCSSVTTLELSLLFDKQEVLACDAALNALVSIPGSVEDLRILVHRQWRSDSQGLDNVVYINKHFGLLDEMMTDAVLRISTRGSRSSLRSLAVHCFIEEEKWSSGKFKVLRLPRLVQQCSVADISCSVFAEIVTSSQFSQRSTLVQVV